MARDIQHQASPGESWTIVDSHRWNEERFGVRGDQLRERLHASEGSGYRWCIQASRCGRDFELVRLVFAHRRIFGSAGAAVDDQSGCDACFDRDAGLPGDAPNETCYCGFEACVLMPRYADGKASVDL